MRNQHRISVDADKLLRIIGTVEWYVETGRITYDDALRLLHAAVNESVTNESRKHSNSDAQMH